MAVGSKPPLCRRIDGYALGQRLRRCSQKFIDLERADPRLADSDRTELLLLEGQRNVIGVSPDHPAEFDFRLPTVKIVTDSVTQRPLLRTNRAPSGRGRHTGSDSGFNAMLPLNSL
jgi:hypothetical protein